MYYLFSAFVFFVLRVFADNDKVSTEFAENAWANANPNCGKWAQSGECVKNPKY